MKFFNLKNPLWSIGFRPFFVLALLMAIITTPIWVLHITGLSSFDFSPLSPNQWHANEMIFGFLVAAVIGFLLTASANWTGVRGPHGNTLLIGFFLFLFTRIIFWTTPFDSLGIYKWIGALVPLLVVLHLAKLFIQTKNNRNLILIVPLSMLIVGQFLILSSKYNLGYELALYSVRFLVVVIAGRVIPFFTKNALGMQPKWNHPVLEKLTILTVFLLIFEPFYYHSGLGRQIWIALTTLALLLNTYRLVNWRFFPSYKVKILFILYIAYLWLPIHFFFNLASHFDWLSQVGKPTLHSLAYGCMSIMILGIIHRVTLGHTGRKIQASRFAQIGYVAIVLGSFIRVFGPLLKPEYYIFWLKSSGTLWVLAFLILSFEIFPMLISSRIDNKEY